MTQVPVQLGRCRRHLLRLHAVAAQVVTLGPGPAVCIWTQGCPLACPGCQSEVTWDGADGVGAWVDDVARWLDQQPTSFLTLSGGEPMEQAEPLSALLDQIRASRDWVVTAFTGYSREQVERDIRPGSADLLERLDLLIDGRYRRDLHEPLLWRGSRNQRLHDLTGRTPLPPDAPAGFEVRLIDGSFVVIGVPDEPDFLLRFEAALPAGFLDVSPSAADVSSFPFPTQEMP